ncbi:AEC family transporter [Nigerium massiliense]|uniref:AEC family transporter n=1 Tax=Nigerium massiliense TaxID=1522317 RepID=UPI00058CD13E|nr:AEC family transporter [Nigerium massiliense]
MEQSLSAFASIWIVIAVGWLAGHIRLIKADQQRFMSMLAFNIGSPALMFSMVSKGSLEHVFSRTLLVSVIAIASAGLLYLVIARTVLRQDKQGDVVGALCACYTNAGNLGLPVAIHLLGDGAWMAPIMLVQVGLMQPVALALLDLSMARRAGRRMSPLRYLSLPFRNPITVGILAGLAVNLLHVPVPPVLATPVAMVGGMAVPLMLIAFGVSLRLEPLPGKGPHVVELWIIEAIKIIVMPAVAIAAGVAFGLPRDQLYAVAVIAALPTAQNVYVISQRYRVRERLARDAVFWSTLLTTPTIVALSAVLG